jgi:hypothetical protein
MATGIEIESAPSSNHPLPPLLPFPANERVVTVGHDKSDINLSPWDLTEDPKNSKKVLNSPHVQFHYIPAPVSSWHILSLRGFRRSPHKAIFVADKHIYSVHGLVPLRNGIRLKLGRLALRFSQDVKDDCLHFESPGGMVTDIERRLREIVDSFQVPLPEKCLDAEQQMIDWNKVLFPVLMNAMANPSSPVKPQFVDHYGSRSKFKSLTEEIKQLRNHAFHPSKGPMAARDKKRLVSFYVDFLEFVEAAFSQSH